MLLLIFAKVSVKWKVIYMDEHSFLDISGDTLYFPLYDVKALWTEWVSCWITVLMNGGWSLEMFFNPFFQCTAWFPYVFIWTVDVGTPKVVDDSTFA